MRTFLKSQNTDISFLLPSKLGIAFREMLSIARNQPKCYEILDSMNLSEWKIQDYLKSNRFTKE